MPLNGNAALGGEPAPVVLLVKDNRRSMLSVRVEFCLFVNYLVVVGRFHALLYLVWCKGTQPWVRSESSQKDPHSSPGVTGPHPPGRQQQNKAGCDLA